MVMQALLSAELCARTMATAEQLPCSACLASARKAVSTLALRVTEAWRTKRLQFYVDVMIDSLHFATLVRAAGPPAHKTRSSQTRRRDAVPTHEQSPLVLSSCLVELLRPCSSAGFSSL